MKSYRLFTLLLSLVALGSTRLAAAPAAPADATPWTVDFRYAPPVWQTSICLPDDWQKTLVGQDGSLLYDYPGRHSGFGTRITLGAVGPVAVRQQWLQSAAAPIVHTVKQIGAVVFEEDAFAVAPAQRAATKEPAPLLERLGTFGRQAGWAKVASGVNPVFASVDIGWSQSLRYRFKAPAKLECTVVFGLCEGHHPESGQRVLVLRVEGEAQRTIDLVAQHGRNQPCTVALPARDANDDGWIEIEVAAASGSPDRNTILNALWVFPTDSVPTERTLLSGSSTAAPLAFLDGGAGGSVGAYPRHDLILGRLHNPERAAQTVVPTVTIDSEQPIRFAADRQLILVGADLAVYLPLPYERVATNDGQWVIQFHPVSLAGGAEQKVALGVQRGPQADPLPHDLKEAASLHRRATRFWEKLDLPYDILEVPDTGVQSLLTSSIRNIYQAREIKNDLPAFQVGPTCYRGLWVVDGAFIMESIAYLGRTDEARNGVQYLLNFQRPDGAFMLIDGHWKETGIALWAVARHARLTGDRVWLQSVWPQVQRGFEFIKQMRTRPAPDAPNAGLIPDGFSDGGLPDQVAEYTNVYWTLAGLRAAIEAARWLGDHTAADRWQAEYDEFFAAFRRAAARDLKTDSSGNRYLPIRMARGEGIPAQKAQWAFCHAVFPGKIFTPDDPLVQGNLAMLRANEAEGLVLDTGWLKQGIWNYFGSFYAHAWLWLGDGAKAAETLYAFANHASPMLLWREEHMPAGGGDAFVGDMPHNWASAEFIRLVRHALVLERGSELHLLEAIPPSWLRPGAITRVRNTPTEFGPVSMELVVNKAGTKAELSVKAPRRDRPGKIVVHVGHWGQEPGWIDMPTEGNSRRVISLRTP